VKFTEVHASHSLPLVLLHPLRVKINHQSDNNAAQCRQSTSVAAQAAEA
jgi:hypothetical protein